MRHAPCPLSCLEAATNDAAAAAAGRPPPTGRCSAAATHSNPNFYICAAACASLIVLDAAQDITQFPGKLTSWRRCAGRHSSRFFLAQEVPPDDYILLGRHKRLGCWTFALRPSPNDDSVCEQVKESLAVHQQVNRPYPALDSVQVVCRLSIFSVQKAASSISRQCHRP